MKRKAIYPVIVIILVAILAVCFRILPKNLNFDFDSNPIESVITTYATDPADPYNRWVQHPNQAQIDELQSRLMNLSGAQKVKEYSDAITVASIEIGLADGSSINFQSKNDGTLQLICQPPSKILQSRNDGILILFGQATPKVYIINNEDFHRYVINVCSGGDRAPAIPDGVTREADRLAEQEWEYVRETFPERSYSAYKLETVNYVLTCEDIEDETLEVYGITCSYKRDDAEEWECAENADRSYFVFQSIAGGLLEWVCDIRTSYTPGTDGFKDDLHKALMGSGEQYIFKLLADKSLDKTLEQTLQEYVRHIVPGDGFYFGWKQLAQDDTGESGTVYGILLFHSASGSPLIYSEKLGRYCSAIYSTYLLPVSVSYEKDTNGSYAITSCWTPSKENYEQDILERFPTETADLVLKNLNRYTTEMLQEIAEHDAERVQVFFPGGPVWPEYSFDKALDNTALCGIATYYPEGDIYYKPTHDELLQRLYDDPVSLLNGLGLCNEEARDEICEFISEQSLELDLNSISTNGLTPEGEIVFAELKSFGLVS